MRLGLSMRKGGGGGGGGVERGKERGHGGRERGGEGHPGNRLPLCMGESSGEETPLTYRICVGCVFVLEHNACKCTISHLCFSTLFINL